MDDLAQRPATRRLLVGDLEAVRVLRRQALDEAPWAFASSPADDRLLLEEGAAEMLAPSETQALFGAFAGERLVGLVGILRLTKAKLCHRAELWGMYVDPAARTRGLGRALLEAALAWARAAQIHQVHLGVTDAAPAARRLYESAGFHCWGSEPTSILHADRFVTTHYLVLVL